MAVERFIIEVSLLLIVLTPMFEDTSTTQNEDGVNDKDYFNGDNKNIFSNLDTKSSQREVKRADVDKNVHLDDYDNNQPYDSERERKSIDYELFKAEYKKNKPYSIKNKLNYKHNYGFQRSNRNIQIPIRNGKFRFAERNTSTVAHGTKTNEHNIDLYKKQQIQLSNDGKSENADLEEDDDYDRLDEDANINAKPNKYDENEKKCKPEEPKGIVASLQKYSPKLSLPNTDRVCETDEQEMKNKLKKNSKNENKDLGVLQPANEQRIKIVAHSKCFNSKLGNAENRQQVKTKPLHHEFGKIYKRDDSDDYNKVSRKLVFPENKLKIKPRMKSRYDHALRYGDKRFKTKENAKEDATFKKGVIKSKRENRVKYPYTNFETKEEKEKETRPEPVSDSDVSNGYKHYRSTNNGKELILTRNTNKNIQSSNAYFERLQDTKASDNEGGNGQKSAPPDVYLSTDDEHTNNRFANFLNTMLLNGTSKKNYYETDFLAGADSNIYSDKGSGFNSGTTNARSDAMVENRHSKRHKTTYVNDNKSSHSEDKQDAYGNLKAKDGSKNYVEYHKKRSIVKKVHEPVNERTTDLSDKDDNLDNIERKLDKEKSISINYDYDKNDYNGEDNINSINKSANDFKVKDVKQSNEDSDKRSQSAESGHKKSVKPSSNKKTYSRDDDVGNRKQAGVNGKKFQSIVKTELLMTENMETAAKASTAGSYTFSRKQTEIGKSRYKDHTSIKPVDKECHPPAGPPKFKWCSEETGSGRDQEYEDALKGRIALRIVEVILAKVHKSSKMSHDFGFCRNDKKGGNSEDGNCDSSILKSQDLKEIMIWMKKLSCKACNQLPPKLKDFLEWLIKVKNVRSVHANETPFGKHFNCSLGESAFLFHEYDMGPHYERRNLIGDDQENCDNSEYKDVANCKYDRIKKGQDDREVNNEFKLDLDPPKNGLALDTEKELYNTKLKRYATENEDNYPYSESSVANERFETPFRTGNDINSKYLYSDPNRDHLNSYEHYLNNARKFKPRQQSERIDQLPWSLKNSVHGADEFSSLPYNSDQFSKQIPFDNFRFKTEDNYESNNLKQYDDLFLTRKKRNHGKLQLQEFTPDKRNDLTFEDEFKRASNMDDRLRDMFSDNGAVENMPDGSDESGQQLGFYTPVVFRIPDDYEN